MKRIEVLKALTGREGLFICNLGLPSRELYSLGDRPFYFYMLGSMGMASSVGLGLDMAQKKRVYVVDGDGSILMNLGSLATISHHAPRNYCLVIIDNKCYGSTGNQPTLTAHGTDLEEIARGAGFITTKTVQNIDLFDKTLDAYRNESLLVIAKTDSSHAEAPHIPLIPRSITKRFRREVLK